MGAVLMPRREFVKRVATARACIGDVIDLGYLKGARAEVDPLLKEFPPKKQDMDASELSVTRCEHCGISASKDGPKLAKCARCKEDSYCGRECQLAHWKAGHKGVCVATGS